MARPISNKITEITVNTDDTPPRRMSNRKSPLPKLSDMLNEADLIYAYDADIGGLIWRAETLKGRCGKIVIGKQVGGDDGHGYRMCMLLKQKFKVHQIVWLVCKREFPSMPIDHIDGNRRNNKIENLRLATDHQNTMNISSAKREFAGIRPTASGKFRTAFQYLGKKYTAGTFPTKEEARAAYIRLSRAVRCDFSPV